MSTFCVFGIKKSSCIEKARKLIPTAIKKVSLTVSEHSYFAGLLSEHLFLDDEIKTAQISPAFDSPKFAQDWMDLATKSGEARRLKIMAKVDKKDKGGEFIIKKGARIKTWEEYKC